MRNLFALFFIAFLLAGCGTLKRQHTDLATQETTQHDSSTKARHVVRERTETTASLPGSTVTGSKPAQNIITGEPLVVEDATQTVTVAYNPETKNIQVEAVQKPRDVNVTTTKEEERNDETAVKTETAALKEERTEQVDRKPGTPAFLTGFIVFGGLMFLLLLYLVYRRLRAMFFPP